MIGWVERTAARIAGLPQAVAIMLVVALPGFFSLPPIDRDEARFAQSSAQMLDSGDFIDIRLGDRVRYKKPIGIYWLQAASAAITGAPGDIWSYRLVSLAGAALAVGFTYAMARLVLPISGALLAATILASSLLLGAEARLAKTDAMLLATIMAGQYVLACGFLPKGRLQTPDFSNGQIWLFWSALAAGILIKGPISALVIGATLPGVSLWRRDLALWRALKPGRGVVLVALLVLPWLIAITIKSNGAFWAASVGQDLVAKLAQGQENHAAPPGSYLALIWFTFWPGSALLLAALPAIWIGRRDPVVQFGVLWSLPLWLVFEATATKLPHYVLPAYPALALLVAWAVMQRPIGKALWAAGILAALVPGVLLVAFFVAANRLGGPIGLPFWLGTAGLLLALAAFVVALRAGAWHAVSTGLAGMSLALSVAIYPSLARMQILWPSAQIASLIELKPECGLSVVGYSEASLLFQTDRRATIATLDEAMLRSGQPGCLIFMVDAALAFAPAGFGRTSEVRGLNLGSGKTVHLLVYERD